MSNCKGLNSVLNEANEKEVNEIRICHNKFDAQIFRCCKRKCAPPPPPSSYCSSPPIKDKVPFHQPIPFIMTSPTLYLLFIGNINPPFYHAPSPYN